MKYLIYIVRILLVHCALYSTIASAITEVPYWENFEDGLHTWKLEDYNSNGEMGLEDCGAGVGKCLHITNPALRAEAWYVSLSQVGFSNIIDHGLYRGTLKLRAQVAGKIEISLLQNNAPYTNFGLSETCNITTEWTVCSFYFMAQNSPEQNAANIRLSLGLGMVAGSVWMDDFALLPATMSDGETLAQHANQLTPLAESPSVVFSNTGQAILRVQNTLPTWFDGQGAEMVPLSQIQAITWYDWQGSNHPGVILPAADGTSSVTFSNLPRSSLLGEFRLLYQNREGRLLHDNLLLDGFGVVPNTVLVMDNLFIGYANTPPQLIDFIPGLYPWAYAPEAVVSDQGMMTVRFSNPDIFWFSNTQPNVSIPLTADSVLIWDGAIYSEEARRLEKMIHPWVKRRGYLYDNGDNTVTVTFNGMPLEGSEGNLMILQPNGQIGWAFSDNVKITAIHGAQPILYPNWGYFGYSSAQSGGLPKVNLPLNEDFEDGVHSLFRIDAQGTSSLAIDNCPGYGQCLRMSNPTLQAKSYLTQLAQVGFVGFEIDKTYRIALSLKADQTASLPLMLEQNSTPYTSLAPAQNCQVSTEWSVCQIDFTFQDTEVRPENIALTLSVGLFTGTLWVDNLFIGEPAAQTTPTPTPISVGGSRIINMSISDLVKQDLNMGFIASGQGTVKVLLRAWNLEFAGIPSIDPILQVKQVSDGQLIAQNDDWHFPTMPCLPIPVEKQQVEFNDARNAACYLEIIPNKGYVISLQSKYGAVAQAQLSADVDAWGDAALINGSTTFMIDASNRGRAGMGIIIFGDGQLSALTRVWNLGFAGISPNTDPSLLLRRGDNLATLALNDNFAQVSGICQSVTPAMLINPEFYQEPRNAACFSTVDANTVLHLLGSTPIDGTIQMSLDLIR